MGKSLLHLAETLENSVAKIDKQASEIATKTALTIITDLVYITPVDTSRALSNWQISLNTPVQQEVLAYYLGESGSTKSASASATIEEAKNILKNKKPGEIIYLSNILPYINRLNEGYSGQAPAGFVERAVLLGRNQVEKSKVGLNGRRKN